MARELEQSRAEVLQALLQTMDSQQPPEATNGAKFTPDQIKKLAERLNAVVGDGAHPPNGANGAVNEEGLPIIEITEPEQGSAPALPSASSQEEPIHITPEPQLIPIYALHELEQTRLRAERDRVLDALEAEELSSEHHARERAAQEQREAAERRAQDASQSKARLLQQREMQKKLGKALLKNMADARSQADEVQRAARQEDVERDRVRAENRARELKPKKSVSFADLPPGTSGSGPSSPVPPLPTPAERSKPEHATMTVEVVERFPSAGARKRDGPGTPVSRAAWQRRDEPDSDDETPPSSPGMEDANKYGAIQVIQGEGDGDDTDSASGPSSSDDAASPPDSDDDGEYDEARHRMQIARAYHEKRETIGAEALASMTAHTHDSDTEEPGGEHPWDQPEVPLDATLASSPPKPAISRFKAERSGAPRSFPDSAPSPSTSLGASIVPASHVPLLRQEIHTGKLEEDRLVSSRDSDSEEEDPALRELLQAIARGDVTNTGPQTQPSTLSSQPDFAASNQPLGSASGSSLGHAGRPVQTKISRFKTEHRSATASGVSTPISEVSRSSPKGMEIDAPAASRPAQPPLISNSHTIVESPSFPPTGSAMIVDSPSFPRQPDAVPSASLHSPVSPSQPTSDPSRGRRPQQPPMVMSASVLERRPAAPADASAPATAERRTSRFKASRA